MAANGQVAAPPTTAQPVGQPSSSPVNPPLGSLRPSYPPPASSITVPFANDVDFRHLTATLKLLVDVNGGTPHAFTIDTGSVGVLLPAEEIPGFDPNAPGNTPGELRYSSSGLKLTGYWTQATLHFLDPKTRQVLTEAHVDVLAVTEGTCTGGGPNASHCTGNIPHMMGVGFGRGYDAKNGMRAQAGNPFVNLQPMNAPLPGVTMHHGYVITPAGITFGLTNTETRGFQFVKLKPVAGTGQVVTGETGSKVSEAAAFTLDYQTAPGYLSLGSRNYPMGTVLIDTGLTNMMIAEDGEPSSGDVPSREETTVHLLGDAFRYHFTTGLETQSVAPRRISWVRFTHGPFINTGLRALACFDYLYDAENGYLGLRPTCKTE